MNNMAAVSKPRKKKEIILNNRPIEPWANDIPSKMSVIQIGRTLFLKRAANPNVKTTIRDDFLFSFSSSR